MKTYLAIAKNGCELIFQPEDEEVPYRTGLGTSDEISTWRNRWVDDPIIELPKGTIEKLIGKSLTWDDEPFELI